MTTRIAIFGDRHGHRAAAAATLAAMAAAIRAEPGLPDHVARDLKTGGLL